MKTPEVASYRFAFKSAMVLEFVRDQRGAIEIVSGKVRHKIRAIPEDRAVLGQTILSKDFSAGQRIFPPLKRSWPFAPITLEGIGDSSA